ncbi:MAG: hypothetical protein ACYS8W_12450 [Planctomycetota bacterium]|jgi:hypothetical protein
MTAPDPKKRIPLYWKIALASAGCFALGGMINLIMSSFGVFGGYDFDKYVRIYSFFFLMLSVLILGFYVALRIMDGNDG